MYEVSKSLSPAMKNLSGSSRDPAPKTASAAPYYHASQEHLPSVQICFNPFKAKQTGDRSPIYCWSPIYSFIAYLLFMIVTISPCDSSDDVSAAKAIGRAAEAVLRSDGSLSVFEKPTIREKPITLFPKSKIVFISGGQNGIALGQNGEVSTWDSVCSNEEVPVCRVESRSIGGIAAVHAASVDNPKTGGTVRLIVDQYGNVFGLGDDSEGQISGRIDDVGSQKRTYIKFVRVPLPVRIKKVYLGAFHAMAIDEAGVVWTWGGKSYQLARGSGELYSGERGFSATRLTSLPKIRSVSADLATYALAEDGKVWRWGIRKEVCKSDCQPAIIDFTAKIEQISTSTFYTLFLDVDRKCYLIGNDSVFGTSKSPDSEEIPRSITMLDGVDVISATVNVAAAIRDGVVLTYGLRGPGRRLKF